MEASLAQIITNSIGAVAVTVLFLAYQWKRGDRVDDLVREVTAEARNNLDRMMQIKNEFLEYNKIIVEEFKASTKEFHDDIRRLTDSHMAVTREVVTAVTELRGTVNALKVEIARKQDREDREDAR